MLEQELIRSPAQMQTPATQPGRAGRGRYHRHDEDKMPLGHVISTLNVKGGVGKTTTALLLAQEMTARGYSTAVVDLDPNAAFIKFGDYRSKQGLPEVFTIKGLADINEATTFAGLLRGLKSTHDFTILDVEGSQNQFVATAGGFSDFAIIPVKHSPLDGWSLRKVMEFIEAQEIIRRGTFPYRVLINYAASGSVMQTWEKEMVADLDRNGFKQFKTRLYDGPIFKDMWGLVSTLDEMLVEETAELAANPKNNAAKRRIEQIEKAILRRKILCDEIFTVMTEYNTAEAAAR